MNKISKITGLVLIFLNVLSINFVVFAADANDIYKVDLTTGVGSAAALIAGYILWFGLIIAVGVLIVKGIRFLTSSVNTKADVKKELIPWAIAVVLLLTFQIILQFVVNISQQNINTIQ